MLRLPVTARLALIRRTAVATPKALASPPASSSLSQPSWIQATHLRFLSSTTTQSPTGSQQQNNNENNEDGTKGPTSDRGQLESPAAAAVADGGQDKDVNGPDTFSEAEPGTDVEGEVEAVNVLELAAKLRLPTGQPESKVLSWAVQVGDQIAVSDPVCEIDAPEYTYDYQSHTAGYVARIAAPANTKVTDGDVLAYVASSKEQVRLIVEALEKEEEEERQREAQAQALEREKEEQKEREKEEAAAAAMDPTSMSGRENVIENLSETELEGFLKGLDRDMSEYAKELDDQGFDSISSICTLTVEDLEEMGVKKGHARIILKGVEALAAKDGSHPSKH
mmetsp:Transcript_16752/g.29642  ORF Transcript_16752/g.29642 Transcript_16752/m.29642 type:complete len:337 (+) Transcript_16752:57-1067(+)